eukprot:6194715-Pleurochrysis_carterae.AAC.1
MHGLSAFSAVTSLVNSLYGAHADDAQVAGRHAHAVRRGAPCRLGGHAHERQQPLSTQQQRHHRPKAQQHDQQRALQVHAEEMGLRGPYRLRT